MAVTILTSDRATTGASAGAVNADIRVTEIINDIFLLEPNSDPLTLLLRKAGKKSVSNPEYKWLEKERTPTEDRINSTGGYTSGATSLVVDNGAYVPKNSIIRVQRTGETMLVTAISTNTLTATRGWGTTTAAALVDNDQFTVLGGAALEGTTAEASRSVKSVTKNNYTQIARDSYGVTGTDNASEYYGGNDLTQIGKERGIEHAVYMEKALWFGEKAEETTAAPRRTVGGVDELISTNSTDFGGAINSLAEVFTFAESAFRYSSSAQKVKMLFASRSVGSNIALLAGDMLRAGSAEKMFGINFSRLVTPHGEWNVIVHNLFEGDTYGKRGYSVDLADFQYVYLRGRDTMLKKGIQANDSDSMKNEYLSEFGLLRKQERHHARMVDASS